MHLQSPSNFTKQQFISVAQQHHQWPRSPHWALTKTEEQSVITKKDALGELILSTLYFFFIYTVYPVIILIEHLFSSFCCWNIWRYTLSWLKVLSAATIQAEKKSCGKHLNTHTSVLSLNPQCGFLNWKTIVWLSCSITASYMYCCCSLIPPCTW